MMFLMCFNVFCDVIKVDKVAGDYNRGCKIICEDLIVSFISSEYHNVFSITKQGETVLWWGRIDYTKIPERRFSSWISHFKDVIDSEKGGKTAIIEHKFYKDEAVLLSVIEKVTIVPPDNENRTRLIIDVLAEPETKLTLAETYFSFWMIRSVYAGLAFSVKYPSGDKQEYIFQITKGDKRFVAPEYSLKNQYKRLEEVEFETLTGQKFIIRIKEPLDKGWVIVGDDFSHSYTLTFELSGKKELNPGDKFNYILEIAFSK